jgi:hypothetical protein
MDRNNFGEFMRTTKHNKKVNERFDKPESGLKSFLVRLKNVHNFLAG